MPSCLTSELFSPNNIRWRVFLPVFSQGLKAVYILRKVNLSVLTFFLSFDCSPAGSPDPGGLPDLECEERFGQRVPQPAFPGQYTQLMQLFMGLIWTFGIDYLFMCFPHLCVALVQVCHIVLGLRPATPEEEGQIIRYVLFISSAQHLVIYCWT